MPHLVGTQSLTNKIMRALEADPELLNWISLSGMKLIRKLITPIIAEHNEKVRQFINDMDLHADSLEAELEVFKQDLERFKLQVGRRPPITGRHYADDPDRNHTYPIDP